MCDYNIASARQNLDESACGKRPEKSAEYEDEPASPVEQKTAVAAEDIESGEIRVSGKPFRFERVSFFNLISIMLPAGIVQRKIKEEAFEFFAGSKHELCVSIQNYDIRSEKNVPELKKKYTEMMTKPKQKTVWIDDAEAKTLRGWNFHYLLAKHPMPENNIYNLIAVFILERNIISFTLSVSNSESQLWLSIFAAALRTAILHEEEQ